MYGKLHMFFSGKHGRNYQEKPPAEERRRREGRLVGADFFKQVVNFIK